jgi:hypothetical protein
MLAVNVVARQRASIHACRSQRPANHVGISDEINGSALNAAPSGTLHNELSTPVAEAKQAVANPNLPAAIAGDTADIVNNDCSSVLPSVSP